MSQIWDVASLGPKDSKCLWGLEDVVLNLTLSLIRSLTLGKSPPSLNPQFFSLPYPSLGLLCILNKLTFVNMLCKL